MLRHEQRQMYINKYKSFNLSKKAHNNLNCNLLRFSQKQKYIITNKDSLLSYLDDI